MYARLTQSLGLQEAMRLMGSVSMPAGALLEYDSAQTVLLMENTRAGHGALADLLLELRGLKTEAESQPKPHNDRPALGK